MLTLLVYTILVPEMLVRRAGHYLTAGYTLEKFDLLAATYLQFANGNWLKSPSTLSEAQQHLIDPEEALRRMESLHCRK